MKAYFGESGLTTTSANHVANLAKEMAVMIEEKLSVINFVTIEVSSIMGNKTFTTQEGTSDLIYLESLDTVSQCHALEAWLREAIKEKKAVYDEFNRTCSIGVWAKEKGIELPVCPNKNITPSEDELLENLPEKERLRYLTLEAEAAVIGKFIHPRGPYNEARKNLAKAKSAPYKTEGSGQEMTIYRYIPTIPEATVDRNFFELQAKHREIQAQLNKIKYEAEQKALQLANEEEKRYSDEYQRYSAEYTPLLSEFNLHKQNELNHLASLKIVIPDELKSIYDRINKLGKQANK